MARHTPPRPGPAEDFGFTRRAFLKGASIAAVGGGVAGELGTAATVGGRGIRTIGQGLHPLELKVNGTARTVEVESRTTLLDALRNGLDLTGSKEVCNRGACGGCTVLLDGRPANSCMTLAFDAEGAEITTIEGLATGGVLHPVQEAFVECDALQCGFCTPGMVMSAVVCLDRHPAPTLAQIRDGMSGNICRCGTYGRVVEAVQRAAGKKAGGVRDGGGNGAAGARGGRR